MPRAARAGAAVAIAVASLAISSCGDTVIDDAAAEAAIKADLNGKLRVKIATVVCPTGIAVEPGRTFRCVVTTAGGARAEAVLRIINRDADVDFTALRPLK